MGFLDSFSASLFEQMGMSENTPTTLDVGGSFGALGDFSSQIDKSAHRRYIESGTIRNIKPRAAEVLMQEPDMTVVVKKRLFSSLIENYRSDLMDEKEKLFIRATKALFYQKCRIISAYERLTKIEKISKDQGYINDFALPMVFGMVDILNSSTTTNTLIDAKTQAVLDTVRNVKALSDPNLSTTWILDRDLPYVSETGEGTGVFELTMVKNMSCTTSTKLGGGRASLTVEDPNKMMIITNDDIDAAINQASNKYAQNNFYQLSEYQLEKATRDLKIQLNLIRRERGATDIRFYVNEQTILYKRVRAVIDSEGREINFVFNAGVLGSNLFTFGENSTVEISESSKEGTNGLQEANNELHIFRQVVQNMYILLGIKQSTQSEIRIYNEETEYVRRKMRLHYANKPIIQPMDVVYIFVGSKAQIDSKISQGLKFNYRDHSLLNKLNEAVGGINDMVDDLKSGFGGTDGQNDSYIESEKNAIAGPDFPIWLWTLMRNDFTKQTAGTCVFVGPVATASHTYSSEPGAYTLNVEVKDNSHYFEMGQINIKPSLHVYNGPLYDPLTPFEHNFDAATGFERPELLNENIELLNTECVRLKLGRNRGRTATPAVYDYKEIEAIDAELFGGLYGEKYGKGQTYRKLYYEPDGFVYRWKEGIGSLVVYGEPHQTMQAGSFQNDTTPHITKSPFAGQDVMNVLSLLVTNQPYNFNSFMSSAVKAGVFNANDLLKGGSGDISYMRGLLGDIAQQNATWGNFIPFKKLIINDKGYNHIIQAGNTTSFTFRNAQLTEKLREKASLVDQLNRGLSAQGKQANSTFNMGVTGAVVKGDAISDNTDLLNIFNKIQGLDGGNDKLGIVGINDLQRKFWETLQDRPNLQGPDGTLSIFGNDVSFDPTITNNDTESENKRIIENSEFRKKLFYLTQRRLWKVKANEDSNLFIVDDSYDKNYDIQAFERGITDMSLFGSTFTDIKSQINQIASILGLEVFADSQGHIQARPPHYNRTPKSVFRDMLVQKAEKGYQLFPEYLESLFFTKLDNLIDNLEVIEDKIRLKVLSLGYDASSDKSDSKIEQFLSSGAQFNSPGGKFTFITSGTNGKVQYSQGKFLKMFDEDNPDLQEDRFKSELSGLSTVLKDRLNATVNFSVATMAEKLNSLTFKASYVPATRTAEIRERLRKGKNIYISDTVSKINALSDVLSVMESIGTLVSERQRVIKNLSNTLKNFTQGLSINEKNSNAAQNVLLPNIRDVVSEVDDEYPEILEHMIEDENVDDLGPNSGQRYIINEHQIKSITVNEKAPEYTIIQVNGGLENRLVPFPSSADLGVSAGAGGNAMGSAFAVDYDMWRMYGFRSPHTADAPFFSNPTTQCAPYAVFLLNLARKNIFQGTLELAGNEFIQPGEVYYIDDRDLLVYSESVSHNYAYNSRFDTTVNWTYGRNPGEYIPTQLDVIGQGLYNNKYNANHTRHVRHGRADDDKPIATLIYDKSQSSDIEGDLNKLVTGKYGEYNRRSLANIMLVLSGVMTPTDLDKKLSIEVRYYENSSPEYTDINLLNKLVKSPADAVRKWIVNPKKPNKSGAQSLIDNGVETAINVRKVSVELVDLSKDDDTETKSPSQEAWEAARVVRGTEVPIEVDDDDATDGVGVTETAATNESSAIKSNSKSLVKALFSSVIDIWAVYEDPDDDLEKQDGVSEKANEDNAKVSEIEDAKAE